MLVPPIQWTRFWFPAGSAISSIDGYLPDPDGWMGPHVDVQGRRIESLNDIPCLVLLGIPGMGKTSEMNHAADRAREAGELVDLISLARLTGPAELHSRLTAGPNLQDWLKGKPWNVFLDGLDEALAQLTQIEKAIPEVLRIIAQTGGTLDKFRLRISCRSAEWPQALEAELRTLWDKNGVQSYELGHLRRKDVALAVERLFQSDSQRQSFFQYIQDHDAEPLASRPVTLNMLLNVFRHESELPKQQVQLYRRGLLASIEEANDTRRQSLQTWRLDLRSKLMVAARIAASCIFSNRSEIWIGHQSQVAPVKAVVLSEIAGGYEPSLLSSFHVGESELREALLTSLFVPIGPDLFGWTHQTFAEFLSAYYLVERRLTADDILEFLRGSGEATGQIAPQLIEVAAWVASMQPEFFRALIRFGPAILLRSDVAAALPEDREALVRELLQRFDSEQLHDFQLDFRSRYGRLNHSGLGQQLRPYIIAKSKNLIVRRVAIDMAEANNLLELADLLADIALDATDNIHIRAQAASAVWRISDLHAKARLRPLITGDHDEDIDDELKGYALRAVWPEQLSVRELLRSLTLPKNDSFFGAYAFFLSEFEIPTLSDTDALIVVDWMSKTIKEEKHHTTFDRVIPKFLESVLNSSDIESVRSSLAEFLLEAARHDAYWSYSENIKKLFADLWVNNDRRKALIVSILHHEDRSDGRDQAALLSGSTPLLTKEDLPWLVELLVGELKEETKRSLANIIVGQTFGRSLDEMSFVWDAADDYPFLLSALTRAYTLDLSSAVAKWQREDFERKKRRAAEEQAQPFEMASRIEHDLAKVETQSSFDWWRLNLLMFAQLDGRIDPSSEFGPDLMKSRGWAVLSDSVKSRVVIAAKRYLVENRIRSSTWLGTNTFHRPAAAGYRAFRLLFSESHNELYAELSKNVWRKWTSAILGVSFNEDQIDRDVRQKIVKRCYELAPNDVVRVFFRLASKRPSEFDTRNLLEVVEQCFDERLGNLLWNFISGLGVGDVRAKPVIRFLIQSGYAPAVQLTTDLVNQSERVFDSHIRDRDELAVAIASLIQRDTTKIWPSFSRLQEQDADLATRIAELVTDAPIYEGDQFYTRLSEAEMADLYCWLFRQIPPTAEERSRGGRFLGVDDRVDQLRQAILRNLVARGTAAAVASVQNLAKSLPELPWLKWQVIDARSALASKSWKQLGPAEAITIVASYHSMPEVRSTKEVIKTAVSALESANHPPVSGGPPPSAAEASETIPLPQPPTHEHVSVKPRRILAVATEWRSSHGGLSTLNRELCIALAAAGHRVVCLVIDPTPREVDEAAAADVRLIGCPRDPVISGLSRLLLFHRALLADFVPELVIGHDHLTGSSGNHIAHHVYTGSAYVHFIHTLPEEIEVYKSRGANSILRGAEKAEVQYQQCQNAQLVVGVGPRIHREMSTRIAPNSNVPVVCLRPGLNRNLLSNKVDLSKPRTPYCLFMGRLEDGDLKGAGLACQMIRTLNLDWPWQAATRPRLILRGFDPANLDSEIAAIGGIEDAKPYLVPRPYTPDSETIANDIRSSCVIIMPSKREGFGLVALEGIAAGIPVLVTAESGMGEMLLQNDIATAIGQSVAEGCVADVDGDIEKIRKDWATRAQKILSDPSKAFASAEQVRLALQPLLSWEKAAEQFSSDIESILT